MIENKIPGYMTVDECIFLKELFKKYNLNNCIGVEIGSFLGRSSVEISSSVPNAKLFCIDRWDDWEPTAVFDDPGPNNLPQKGTKCSFDVFLNNTRHYTNIIPIKGESPDCVKNWYTDIDFIFLDAAHFNPSDKMSIDFWLPKVKKGGTFAGHDYSSMFPDVISNVKYIETYLNKPVVLPNVGSIWYFTI